jgi:hypothetical protein
MEALRTDVLASDPFGIDAFSERSDEPCKRILACVSIGPEIDLACNAPSLFSKTHGFTFNSQIFGSLALDCLERMWTKLSHTVFNSTVS